MKKNNNRKKGNTGKDQTPGHSINNNHSPNNAATSSSKEEMELNDRIYDGSSEEGDEKVQETLNENFSDTISSDNPEVAKTVENKDASENDDSSAASEVDEPSASTDREETEIKLTFGEKIGNLFAPVRKYKEEIDGLQKKVEDLNAKYKEIDQENTSKTTTIVNLQSDLDDANEQLVKMQSSIDSLKEENGKLIVDNRLLSSQTYTSVAYEIGRKDVVGRYGTLKDAIVALHAAMTAPKPRTVIDIMQQPTPEERKTRDAWVVKSLYDNYLIAGYQIDFKEAVRQIKEKIEKAKANPDKERLTSAESELESIRKELEEIRNALNETKKALDREKFKTAKLEHRDYAEEIADSIKNGQIPAKIEEALHGWLLGKINSRIENEERHLQGEGVEEVMAFIADKVAAPSEHDEAIEYGKSLRNEEVATLTVQLEELRDEKSGLETQCAAKDSEIEKLQEEKTELDNNVNEQLRRVEELKSTYKAGLEKIRVELDDKHSVVIRSMEERHAEEIKALKEAGTAALEANTTRYKDEIRTLKDNHRAEIESLKDKCAGEIEALTSRHAGEVKELKDEHAEEIRMFETEMETLNKKHTDEIESLKDTHKTEVERLDASHKQKIASMEEKHAEELVDLNRAIEEKDASIDELYGAYTGVVGGLMKAIDDNVQEAYTRPDRETRVAEVIDRTIIDNDMFGLDEFLQVLAEKLDEVEGKRSAAAVKEVLRENFSKLLKINSATWIDCLARMALYANVPFVADNFISNGADTSKLGEAYRALKSLLAEAGIELSAPRLFIDEFNEDDYEAEPIKTITTMLPEVASHVNNDKTIIDLFTVGYSVDGQPMRKPAVSRLNA